MTALRLTAIETRMKGKPVVTKTRSYELTEDQFRKRHPDILYQLRQAGLTRFADGHRIVFTVR